MSGTRQIDVTDRASVMDGLFQKIIDSLLSEGGVTAWGGWLMFFWSEWRRDKAASEYGRAVGEMNAQWASAQQSVVKVLEGLRAAVLGKGAL